MMAFFLACATATAPVQTNANVVPAIRVNANGAVEATIPVLITRVWIDGVVERVFARPATV